ncbi:ImmA/IrrE family metallo-endopeptidase [Siccirubricoccus sp. KC 17139]|uniref:ImmA/IrrE family metallo-endopeptidase n=1 Tax=Siccirubricoccus soli TaxID=2899147 RepID=A0ABT1D8W0_9PROT|nr:ImmA/IrrE family metallo-endopeptidase [Siccirubricoccus soli]MCO6418353.1 ImmA/IrrE family metallo-endopeptidase [Siccirubricoccus soli]MCP2684488.1 ImmA/IrrE family metallo-endopeptidase [Siccirubricoccus soli]
MEGFVARHFGYRLRPGGGFEPAPLPQALFKVRKATTAREVVAARGFATAVARLVAQAASALPRKVPADPSSLRELAVAVAEGRGWVDFAALVEASWQLGIPVIYLPELPVSGRKPDGLVTFVAGRPVVVLLKNQRLAEWMVFVLAHELGHVALGHLGTTEGAAVVDEKVSLAAEEPVVPGNEPEDNQEREANAYASHVLVPGGIRLTLGPWPWPRADRLAARAIEFGKRHGICPGHAVLNAVKHSSRGNKEPFALGMAALKVLHETMDARTTAEICRDAARRHLDLDLTRPDTADFLEKLEVI